MTWSEWKQLVAKAYNTTAPNAMAVYRACAAFTKGQITREVDRDIPLSRSYRDNYAELRVSLAGFVITEDLNTIKAGVLRLLTVDAARPAIANFISDSVQQAIDELSAGTDLYNALLLEAAIHLQEHVETFQGVHETYYKASDLGAQGAISFGQLPSGCSPQTMSYLRYAQALAEGAAYDADDMVESNQRLYKVTVGGTIGPGQLGAGLTSTDSTVAETIDGVSFVYDGPVVDTVLDSKSWDKHRALSQADPASSPVYVWGVDPASNKFFVCPMVDADHQLCLEWNGIKRDFENADDVPFEEQAARGAAEYIRSHLSVKFEENSQQAAVAETRYKEALRRLSADSLSRKAGV